MSKIYRILAWIAAAFSLWYIGLDVARWVKESPISNVDTLIYITRLTYVLPKVGILIALYSIYRLRQYTTIIYSISWAVAILHTALYYRGIPLMLNDWEIIVLIIHHLVPHSYFLLMLWVSYNCKKS